MSNYKKMSAEQIYESIHKDSTIKCPDSFARMCAYDYDDSDFNKHMEGQRDKWHEVVLMIEENWHETTGGYELTID
jgi:hypothetical protein